MATAHHQRQEYRAQIATLDGVACRRPPVPRLPGRLSAGISATAALACAAPWRLAGRDAGASVSAPAGGAATVGAAASTAGRSADDTSGTTNTTDSCARTVNAVGVWQHTRPCRRSTGHRPHRSDGPHTDPMPCTNPIACPDRLHGMGRMAADPCHAPVCADPWPHCSADAIACADPMACASRIVCIHPHALCPCPTHNAQSPTPWRAPAAWPVSIPCHAPTYFPASALGPRRVGLDGGNVLRWSTGPL